MTEKNQIFIKYNGVVNFVGKKIEKDKRDGSGTYWFRDFAVNVDMSTPKYPKQSTLVFTLMGKKMDLVDGITRGMDVDITFMIESKSYVTSDGDTKYFLSLNLIKCEYEGKQQAGATGKAAVDDDDSQDLPF